MGRLKCDHMGYPHCDLKRIEELNMNVKRACPMEAVTGYGPLLHVSLFSNPYISFFRHPSHLRKAKIPQIYVKAQ